MKTVDTGRLKNLPLLSADDLWYIRTEIFRMTQKEFSEIIGITEGGYRNAEAGRTNMTQVLSNHLHLLHMWHTQTTYKPERN